MKQKNIIIGAAIVGVAGYLGYRAIKKARAAKKAAEEAKAKAEAEKKAGATTGGATTGGGTGYQGPTEYQQKVMTLQTRLGIGVDGNPGTTMYSQTNLTTRSWFPLTFAKLGPVSPSNIDAYLALGTKKEPKPAPPPQYTDKVKKLKDALDQGRTLRINTQYAISYLQKLKPDGSAFQNVPGLTFEIQPGATFTKDELLSSNLPYFWVVELPTSKAFRNGNFLNLTGGSTQLLAINPNALDISVYQ